MPTLVRQHLRFAVSSQQASNYNQMCWKEQNALCADELLSVCSVRTTAPFLTASHLWPPYFSCRSRGSCICLTGLVATWRAH